MCSTVLTPSLSTCLALDECGFAQVLLECRPETACRRDAQREPDARVGPEIIGRMASRIERPKPAKHHWERHSLVLDSEKAPAAGDVLLSAVCDLVTAAHADPARAEPLPDEDAKVGWGEI